MKHLRKHIAAAALALTGAQAMAFGTIIVTEPGADSYNIETLAFNGSSYGITKLTFDFSDTITTDGSHLVIDGAPWDIVLPTGGSATFFGSGAVFGFDFTGFDTFETFKFKWAPDSAINGGYGTLALGFVGAKVTAVTTGGIYSGVFSQVGTTPDVSAVLSPVPEAHSLALSLAGLAALGAAVSRRTRKA